MSKPILVRNFQMWNMSISMWFGKSPKCEIICGSCGYYFAKRFTPEDFKYGYKGYPVVMCAKCHKSNYVPVIVS